MEVRWCYFDEMEVHFVFVVTYTVTYVRIISYTQLHTQSHMYAFVNTNANTKVKMSMGQKGECYDSCCTHTVDVGGGATMVLLASLVDGVTAAFEDIEGGSG
ncbi:hypothetical protein L2E82_10976 [Cichorium intybus]|uniref:Uncharacterized protein n=1 Tax=Cichorium intybus TaxID=13427 RepID=A0ACB9GD59_CICIN|nr:hypothetical protein L2E82_10976 [Cichorium intybus]